MWGDIYLLIAFSFSLGIVLMQYPNEVKDIKVASCTAIIICLAADFILLFDGRFAATIKTLLLITSLSLVFVILLMLIRRLKPEVFQYPYPVVFLPLLLPVSFAFVMEILIVEQIILASIQSVIIVVLFLLIAGYREYFQNQVSVITGITALITAFVLYWMLAELWMIADWAWKLTVSFGILLTIKSMSNLLLNKFTAVEDQQI